jgi:GTP-binding protein Era
VSRTSKQAPPSIAEESAATPTPSAPFRSGFVALCGRPNVGKSTLLNALLGEELAVATARPQTTRERMLGIWDTDEFQAVLVDTPGIHRAKSALNRHMVDEALRGASEVDLVLLLAEMPALDDAEKAIDWQPGAGALAAFEKVKGLGLPLALVITKCDRLRDPNLLLPIIERWRTLHPFVAIVPTSALNGEGLPILRELVRDHLPVHDRYFDADQLSDREMRWHAAELVRAELLERLSEELPYSCAVVVMRYHEGPGGDRIEAAIHVERDSQKGIVVGQGGKMIKAISIGARQRISTLTGRPCELFLEVRVTRDWTKDPNKLRELGYVAPETRKTRP